MTPAEVQSLLNAARDGEAAEANLNETAVARIKNGIAARARLGQWMEPGAFYSEYPSPTTVWVVDQEGLAVEVQPRTFSLPSVAPTVQSVRVVSPKNTNQSR